MKKIAVKSVKVVKAPKAKIVKSEKNTDALEMPHRVPGKPHNYRYK